MKANLIFVFLVLAPMLLHLFTAEIPEERATDRPPATEVETKPAPPPKAPARKTDCDAHPAAPAGGGSAEPQHPERLPAQDAVTFM